MLLYVYLIAITAEAMSGALAAGKRNMDLFGVALIAFITALGGGTVRDILLGNFPVGWTQHPGYIYLTIGAGQTVAFVGSTGSGKSTLVKLLLRFYAAQHGRILLDGQAIDSLNLQDLRRATRVIARVLRDLLA